MMPCVKCGHETTNVMDSRWRTDLSAIWRRRKCRSCGHDWTTFEKQQDAPGGLETRKLVKLIDAMEATMAEAVKEFREAVK